MNQFASYQNRWTPENQTNEHFRAGGEGVIGYHSSKYVEDGSYLRLKTLSLDYSLPSSLLRKVYMTNLSLNVAMAEPLPGRNTKGWIPKFRRVTTS